jgi:hypothetical protein
MSYRRGNLDQRGTYYSILGLEVPDSLESVPSRLGRRGDRGALPDAATISLLVSLIFLLFPSLHPQITLTLFVSIHHVWPSEQEKISA